MTDPQELRSALFHYTGTEQWYYNPLYKRMRYTDGVKFFANNAANGAYWFLDIVGTEIHPLQQQHPFLNILLTAMPDNRARIIADDGNGEVIWTRDIDFTDCPEGTWQFYLTGNVLLLPSEY